MKPDWKDAPEWANYLAGDSDGQWAWFENKPHAEYNYQSEGGYWANANGGRVIYGDCYDDWDKSLEEKPNET